MAPSQTNLCNKRPFPVKSVPYKHAQWSAAINALMIHVVASLSDSLCSVRQRGKGVSERSELAPCILYTCIVCDLYASLVGTLSCRLLTSTTISLSSVIARAHHMGLFQLASQRKSSVVLQLRSQRLPREGA